MLDPLEPRRQFATTGLDPTYGVDGAAAIVVADAETGPALFTDVRASCFAPSGAGYVEARQENPAKDGLEQDYQDRYLLYRVSANGTFDPSFGTDGRFELKTPGDIVGFETFAISPTGRLVVTDSHEAYHVFDEAGHEEYGVGNRLTRTINRLSGPSYATGKRVVFSETAAFDTEGRLLIPAQVENKGNAVALFRFTTSGLLDHEFGDVGRGFTRLTNAGINYAPTRLAVGRGGEIALTIIADADTQLGETGRDGSTILTSSIDDALFTPDGTLVRHSRLLSAAAPGNDDAAGSSGNYDLRPLADGTFASLGHAAANGAVVALRPDGGFTRTTLPAELNAPVLLTPAAAVRGWVGGDRAYPALEGSTDRFGTPHEGGGSDQYAVLGDGSLIAAGFDATADAPTLLVQKFDGTGRAAPTPFATARLIRATRTLDVVGTRHDDTITVRRRGDRLHVRINGHISTFALADFDTLHVSTNAGDDTISVNLARQNLAVRLRAGSGDDRLGTDAYQATVDGGGGSDIATLTADGDLNPVGIETLRHPPRDR